MTIAQGSRHDVSFVTETVYGTTPATPSMKRFRNTGTGVNMSKSTIQSAEIRSDRQIQSLRHSVMNVGGSLNFELSYGAFDDWLEAALFGTWATNTLKAGVTPKSFSVERRFTDINQYLVYTGCQPNVFNLSIPAEGMVTGSFELVGRGMTAAGTSLGIPTDVATNEPFASDGGSITEGGLALAVVTGLELSLENGIAPNYVVGSNVSKESTYGRSNVTGTATAFFENITMLNKFINETESSLSITLVDPASNTMTITLPRIKYTGAEIPLDGEGSIVMSMPFQALLDTTTGTNIVITR